MSQPTALAFIMREVLAVAQSCDYNRDLALLNEQASEGVVRDSAIAAMTTLALTVMEYDEARASQA